MDSPAATEAARDLLKQPYARVVIPDEDGLYSAEILEFPGCFAQGESAAEAYANLERAAEAWLLSCLEQGKDIPAPLTNYEASGKFALRLPRGLYLRAGKAAALEGVSLNQYIVNAVSELVGANTVLQRLRELMVEPRIRISHTVISATKIAWKSEQATQYMQPVPPRLFVREFGMEASNQTVDRNNPVN